LTSGTATPATRTKRSRDAAPAVAEEEEEDEDEDEDEEDEEDEHYEEEEDEEEDDDDDDDEEQDEQQRDDDDDNEGAAAATQAGAVIGLAEPLGRQSSSSSFMVESEFGELPAPHVALDAVSDAVIEASSAAMASALRPQTRYVAPADPGCWDVHEKKCCSVDAHPSQPLLITTSNDNTAKIWDVRMFQATRSAATGGKAKVVKPLATFEHGRGCTSAFFSADGDRIVSTGNDDVLRVWTSGAQAPTGRKGGGGRARAGAKAVSLSRWESAPSVRIPHNNHTGRWLSNFRAVLDPLSGGNLTLIGAMGTRHIQLFSTITGKLLLDRGDDERLTAVPTINAFHPSLPIIASSTASGRLHLWS
jgi:hypothetical protein